MKEKLIQLLQNSPATAGRPDDFLDTLADDIQAVIIRAISPGNSDDAMEALEHEVEEVYQSDFGVLLFNLYSTMDFPGKKPMEFSRRKQIIRALIQALLVEQCIDYEIDADELPALLATTTDADTLKRRLRELNTPPAPGASVN